MSHRGRASADETLIPALAAGKTVQDAAVQAHVSARTVHRRLRDPKFRNRVDQARTAIVDATIGQLADLGTVAAKALQELLGSENAQVRLGAVRATMEYLFRANEQYTLARQLAELREGLEKAKTNGYGNDATGSKPTGDGVPSTDGDGAGPGAVPSESGPPDVVGGTEAGPLAGEPVAVPIVADTAALFPPGG